MATARQIAVGIAIACAASVTLAALAMVVCGIFCPPLVIPMVSAFFKFAAVFFAIVATAMLSLELLKVINYATKTTPNPAAAPPAPAT
ncbi:MAG: hypothetical protein K2X50_05740 [Gammaproteobacteria bacterium]|nr:hypothetical protein [Gammaproteobacteria bacterium]